MENKSLAIEVLTQFPAVRFQHADCLHNAGGFSGACLWRITTPTQVFCLRRWPLEHPSRVVLSEIHRVLQYAHCHGVPELPAPLHHRGGDSVLKHRRALFELTPWMPGQADYHQRPSAARLNSAMTALARFHAATDSYQRATQSAVHASSPGLAKRHARLARLQRGELDRLAAAVAVHPDADIRQRGDRLLGMVPRRANDVLRVLAHAAGRQVPLQPCIRDVWHDHVLFTDERVTGLIDFGAMRTENVACDVARLAGSLVGDDPPDRNAALEAYQTVRPLTADEQLLIRAFDQSTVLLSGLNWLQWICIEGKRFDDRQRVLLRLDEILVRMEYLCR